MKHFVDGDQLVITKDDFVDLQESPALFYPLTSETAETVLEQGFLALPLGDLRFMFAALKAKQLEEAKDV